MTSKERVLAALAGQPVDRLPHDTPFVGADFLRRWREEKQPAPGVSADDYYGIDVTILCADETPFFSEAAVLEDGPEFRVRRDGWGRVIREKKGAAFYEVVGTAADKGDDYLAHVFDDPLDPIRYRTLSQQLAACESKQLAGFPKIGGPFLRTTFWRGEAEFLMDIAADPGYARELADKMADHLCAVAVESLRRCAGRAVGMSMWDDMAYNNGPFFSPQSFERIFLPGYERIVKASKDAGAQYFFFHSDGDIRPMLPYLADIGVDIINPVEPRAGMDVLQLREEYAGRLTFLGGVDNSGPLCFGTPSDVRAHVAPIARAARDLGGIIVGTHSVESDVPVANYEAYYETVMSA